MRKRQCLPSPHRRHRHSKMNCSIDTFSIKRDHSCGKMHNRCPHCNAKYFDKERKPQKPYYTKCCQNGKFTVTIPPLPEYFINLLQRATGESKLFIQNSRVINTNISFASIKSHDLFSNKPGVPTVKISGSCYHFMGPVTSSLPLFLATYFTENNTNTALYNNIFLLQL